MLNIRFLPGGKNPEIISEEPTTNLIETTTEIVEETTEEIIEPETTTEIEYEYVSEYSYDVQGSDWLITGYCPCSICCGQYAYNRPTDENGDPIVYGASGEVLIPGYSCAGSLPFGTLVQIEGLGTFRVDDRGVSGNHLDLYYGTHEEASNVGYGYRTVTILY